MIHLVVYSDSSSEDEDKKSSDCNQASGEQSRFKFNSDKGSEQQQEGFARDDNHDIAIGGNLNRNYSNPVVLPFLDSDTDNISCQQEKNLIDLPISDESDDQSTSNKFQLLHKQQEVELPTLNLKLHYQQQWSAEDNINSNQSQTSTSNNNLVFNCENQLPHAIQSHIKLKDGFRYTHHQSKKSHELSLLSAATDYGLSLESQQSHNSLSPKNPSLLFSKETAVSNTSETFGVKNIFLKENSETRSKVASESDKADTHPKSQLNRKRKFNGSDKQLPVPDAIHSMYDDRQQRWVDNPALHDNRVRSFPHLEGNWATHVFIPVPKKDLFVRFVNHLLELLMPETFQAYQAFHISLSRTVTIRYHWIEPLIDSLRSNFKDLTSCVSDLAEVKMFTNDEKTRTFVSIVLSQDDREFVDYVRAVDKSFAEFKLPAYYEEPFFHISVGWCLGDITDKISDKKLSEAQELLGEFVAASPVLSFVYAHEICCQSGCKSFVITLKDLHN